MAKDLLIKKIFYRSNYRGIKENEQILKKFLDLGLVEYSISELEKFSNFLDLDDIDIYNILLQKRNLPEIYQSDIIKNLINLVSEK